MFIYYNIINKPQVKFLLLLSFYICCWSLKLVLYKYYIILTSYRILNNKK